MKLFGENASDVIDAGPEDGVAVAQAETEMLHEAGTLEQQAVAIESAVGASEDLEAVGDQASASLEEGEGLTDDAIQMATVTVESAMRRLGIDKRDLDGRLAFESSEGQSRRYRTTLVMEGVVAGVRKIWEKLKAWFRNMVQAIKDFFIKFFSNHDKTIDNLKALREKVNATKGKPSGDGKLKKSSVAKTFNINGKVSHAGAIDILKNHVGLTGGVKGLFEAVGKGIDVAAELVKADHKAGKSGLTTANAEKAAQNIAAAAAGLIKSHSVPVKKEEKSTKTKETLRVEIGPLADGESPELSVSVTNKGVLVMKLDRKKSKEAPETISVLKKDECLSLIAEAIEVAKAVREYRSVQREIDAVLDNAIKLIDQAMKTAEAIGDLADDASNLRTTLSEVRGFTSDAGVFVQRFSTLMPAWGIRAANQAGAWVQASLGEYKEKD